MRSEYQHKDVLRIFPWLKARTLISWSERGLIKPDFNEASGRGSARVFSFTNLIEIGTVSELLQNGIPFANINHIMNSATMIRIKKEKKFDRIFWFDRQLVSTNVSMDKAPPWVGSSGSASVEDFLKNGHSLLASVTTVIIINIGNIKRFIEDQIKRAI